MKTFFKHRLSGMSEADLHKVNQLLDVVFDATRQTIEDEKKSPEILLKEPILDETITEAKANNRNYKYHPHILYGVEISAADKLHIVGIFDDNKKEVVNKWLDENLLSTEEGSVYKRTNLD
ncbi:TPA: hypothetical protein ACYSYY_002261 [Streptococcus suis]